ncbi:MFS transporter, SP family, solute carrier family 2 (myo-inositol transporter), member 13 [Mytilus galloprovincialis]|uniref:MFS transporter, SP family, solute carrier family 2 (Myo-inositol transporter), member 13 n=1 Tax=Mytilus galloprovincialis TaxID=29158 RepID=A0A8B6DAV1_MYTGA|nr:MFS transporter, SP family, solute carrier family 2 (myo-inositol transporter), member 13 [Mytilus galloprovincialis]
MSSEKHKNGDMSVSDHEDTSGSKFYVVFLTMFATIGGLLFGYDTGIISGSMLLMKDYFNLTTVYQEAIVSATIGAAALFALIAGIITERFGRKVVIMTASFVFTGGAIMMALSNSKEILLIGRLVVGAGIGFASMSVPIYVAEAAPASIRGALVSLNQLFITIGILLSSIVAGAFSGDKENGWRYMLGIAGVPSIIQFVGFFFLPESPRYLVNKGKVEEARKILEKLRDSSNVDNEMRDIEKSVKESREFEQSNVFATIGKMLGNQPVRKALLLGCLMQFFQQLCGINTVIYYSASILRMSGFPSKLAIWLVCVPFAVNFLATFLGIYLVERAGRRILTLGSFVGIIIALIVLAVGFQLSVIHTPPVSLNETLSSKCEYSKCDPCVRNKDCGFCYSKDNPTTTGSCLPVYSDHPERYADPNFRFQNGTGNFSINFRCNKENYEHDMKNVTWADNYCPTEYSWMAVLGLALFVIGFAPGLGPMPWTVNSEIYPIWARGTAISISTAVNWIANLIVSFTFLSLLESITTYGTFYLFCGISVLGLIVLYFMLPETKNKTLEEVEQLFMSEEYRSKHKKYMTYEAKDNPAFAGEKL